ncbi:MAG TPA: carbonic anhydrase [Ignavibacteria bacterium]|nr:carbonic anhydrase [Ignavibacteria bacterium]
MSEIISIGKVSDISEDYRNTPIGDLLEYHNLEKKFETYEKAEILIGMCMDNRKHLHIPDNFAFIIRAGGANLRYSEFKVSYAIAIGGVRHIALIGHTNCGMVNLESRKNDFIDGLVKNAGWDVGKAKEHFENNAAKFEIGNEVEFIKSETIRLREQYRGVIVAPLLYRVEDNKLYQIKE